MGKFVIALYTGTGNTLYVAKQFPEAEFHFISEFLSGEYILPEDTDKLGILYPVYNGGYPYPVASFVENILALRDNSALEYLFLINTAGRKNETANYNLERLLMSKGIGVSYAASLSFPSGYLKNHQKALSEMKTLAAANKRAVQLTNIVKDIENREMKLPGYRPFSRIIDIISKNMNRPCKSNGLTISEKCNGCGICYHICPMENILIKDGKASYQDICIHCYACFHHCPEKAIIYKKKTSGQYSGLVETKELYRR